MVEMDISEASISSSDDEQKASNSGVTGRGRTYHRHTPLQIQALEAFFEYCSKPDEIQRRDLSKEIGLETQQIKFWFQNRRTQRKSREIREQNSVLEAEKKCLEDENKAIREELGKRTCLRCGRQMLQPQPDELANLQHLQWENAQLKQELHKLVQFLPHHA